MAEILNRTSGNISIHAPCTGSDTEAMIAYQSGIRISIHAPCTGSDGWTIKLTTTLLISIHAPCTGSDPKGRRDSLIPYNFNPRSLHGERLYQQHG